MAGLLSDGSMGRKLGAASLGAASLGAASLGLLLLALSACASWDQGVGEADSSVPPAGQSPSAPSLPVAVVPVGPDSAGPGTALVSAKEGAPAKDGAADEGPMEQIVITSSGLSGFWAVRASSYIDLEVGLLSGVHIRYDGTPYDRDICRLRNRDGAVRATCIAGFTATASGALDEDRLSLRWWYGPATVIFHGKWDQFGVSAGGEQADSIAGVLTGGMAGVSVTGEVPATLHRLTIAEGESEPGGQAEAPRQSRDLMLAVFEDLHRGSLREGLYEGIAAKRLRPAFDWPGAKETAHSLEYIGQIHIRWHRWQKEMVQDVYDVHSGAPGSGPHRLHSLCRIGQGDHGLVVDLSCQTLED